MLQFKDIAYHTPAYRDTLELRNRIMRIPLGRDIYQENLGAEKDAVILGAYEEETLIGVGVMIPKEKVCSLEFLCVDTALQRGGVGGRLLNALEERARRLGAECMTMHARVSAQGFYERHGYHDTGENCIHNGAPVPHVIMEKRL